MLSIYTVWKKYNGETLLLDEIPILHSKAKAFHIARELIGNYPEHAGVTFLVRKIIPGETKCEEWEFDYSDRIK